jgi:hypothetical protein
MFDNLRDMSDDSALFVEPPVDEEQVSHFARPERRVLGMTAGQRFILALLLFATVVVVGFMFLLVFEKVWII